MHENGEKSPNTPTRSIEDNEDPKKTITEDNKENKPYNEEDRNTEQYPEKAKILETPGRIKASQRTARRICKQVDFDKTTRANKKLSTGHGLRIEKHAPKEAVNKTSIEKRKGRSEKDGFFQGAIIGSFLGAALTTVLAKLATE
ncbi:pheromone-regulated protein PRM3 KNAG_0D05090 [Huiozyma naganishii CBS 8797]|uniref:Uncharacterized protein n=1 Tax=Huiozyma naganishii (strain ATCC MYA-139 / BCRC 22969 / CBS 8797 / KCTC 17520 / NBRC 10181 / NCYC 3082 / Yp74L-3) TaxID=1071383 RepID=J7RL63_HUIN7|nr:hypothetical protein KNAG_0D05090 [Kazachstania naganishii CBS 8797]CCK70248.1 hypothetical protein KNAG_0D05090 [Kazachstania naganishii CBS 8797]